MSKQIEALKTIAATRYEEDKGWMLETFTEDDYVKAIATCKTASKAWKAHLEMVAIRAEQQAAYAVAEPAAPAAPAARVVTGEKGQRMLAVGTLGTVAAAPNVLARVGSLCRAPAGKVAGLTLVVGKPCRVRVPYTQACYERLMAALGAAGGRATAQQLAAASTTDFVQYAVRRGWLQPA